jgi:hypothetical protein
MTTKNENYIVIGDIQSDFCPKFEKCNAAFCPVLGGKHLVGEPNCGYMREFVKEGGPERIRGVTSKETFERVSQVATHLTSTAGSALNASQRDIQYKLQRSSESWSQIENLKREKQQSAFIECNVARQVVGVGISRK